MRIKFWGVRGSVPSPGKDTAEVGGNTSCVEVIGDSGESLIVDSGTGIRLLGLDYLKRENASKTINMLISHSHWDHIQGFPFFIPVFLADFTINIYGLASIRKSLSCQMKHPFFPIEIRELKAKIKFHTIGEEEVSVGGFKIKAFTLKHPQEVFGFRITEGGKSLAYSSDTEHSFGSEIKSFIKAIKNVDMLLYDAQYTPDEYEKGRIGWGHSTYEAAVDIVKKAGIKSLVLFHHEPMHNDATVKMIEEKARKLFPDTIAAREGLVLEV